MLPPHLPFSDYVLLLKGIGAALKSREKVTLDSRGFRSSADELSKFISRHRLFGIFTSKELDEFKEKMVIQKTLVQCERNRLIALLKSEHVKYFELKGEVLENLIFKETGLTRYYGDTDIYIQKSDLRKVLVLLQQNSYCYHDYNYPIEKKIKTFGSLNLKGDFSICDLHYSLNKAGKYTIGTFNESIVFDRIKPFQDTYIPEKIDYFNLLLFHFYAKHSMFGLGLLFELLLFTETFNFLDRAEGLGVIQKRIFRYLLECRKILLEAPAGYALMKNPVLLLNNRFSSTYFEKRLSQLLLFLVPDQLK